MNVVIFSKNRAMQLSCLLRSIKKHTDITGVTILWTASNKEFEAGYEKLINECPALDSMVCYFIREQNFKADLLSINFNDYLTCFMVDDDVFLNNFTEFDKEYQDFIQDDSIACLSLRLGKNLDKCYTLNCLQAIPEIINNKWIWRESESDFQYPMSLDGHIFRTSDILPLLKSLEYKAPNSLEGQLAKNPINRPFMSCYETSRLFNMPINRVNTEAPNRYGDQSSEYLNRRYLEGLEINLEAIEEKQNSACHEERTIVFQEAKQCR